MADAQVVAVCDVVRSRAEGCKVMVDSRYQNKDCKCYTDFRRIIEDPAIDAVVISTPDHWHVPMALMALEAGKDVFCEKPTKMIAEGRILLDAVTKRKAVFQMGMEDRSVSHYHNMPVSFDVNLRYSTGVEVNVKSGGTGIRLIGSKGWVDNGSWRGKFLASDEKILHTKLCAGYLQALADAAGRATQFPRLRQVTPTDDLHRGDHELAAHHPVDERFVHPSRP